MKGMSAEDKTKKNLYPRTCKTCGIIFAGGPRAWYCPDCRKKRKNAAKIAYKARKRAGKVREIGSVDTCQKCGEKYIVNGSLQKYCDKCSAEVLRDMDRSQGMEYYRKNRDDINQKRSDTRRIKKYCAICGKEISPIGGRMFCADCREEGRKKQYREKKIARNISKRGESYIVFASLEGKRVYVKCTTDEKEAFRLRDLADQKKKEGILTEWLEGMKAGVFTS